MQKSWTPEHKKYLADNYATIDNETLSIYLDRTVPAIKQRAARFGLKKPNIHTWSESDLKYLSDNYGIKSAVDISIDLNKTVSAVHNKVHIMLLEQKKVVVPQYKKSLPPNRWQDAENFMGMMVRFKRKLMQEGLTVGSDRLFGSLPGAFNQYQVDMGR